jgi:S1-C subfamily serine protease
MKRFALFLFLFTAACVFAYPQAKTHIEITERNAPSVVTVNALKRDGSAFTGTGFVVHPAGVIATNRHVTQDALFINVTFNSGIVSSEAALAAYSPDTDLVLLKIPAKNLPAVTLADSDYALPGEIITVIGNPRRLQNTVTSGLLSQVRLLKDGVVWHQISAPISPSSSGSPVFNPEGNVISVAFSTFKGADNQNLNFAIPSNYLAEMMLSAGYAPKTAESAQFSLGVLGQKFWNHVKRSWEITKKYLKF